MRTASRAPAVDWCAQGRLRRPGTDVITTSVGVNPERAQTAPPNHRLALTATPIHGLRSLTNPSRRTDHHTPTPSTLAAPAALASARWLDAARLPTCPCCRLCDRVADPALASVAVAGSRSNSRSVKSRWVKSSARVYHGPMAATHQFVQDREARRDTVRDADNPSQLSAYSGCGAQATVESGGAEGSRTEERGQ